MDWNSQSPYKNNVVVSTVDANPETAAREQELDLAFLQPPSASPADRAFAAPPQRPTRISEATAMAPGESPANSGSVLASTSPCPSWPLLSDAGPMSALTYQSIATTPPPRAAARSAAPAEAAVAVLQPMVIQSTEAIIPAVAQYPQSDTAFTTEGHHDALIMTEPHTPSDSSVSQRGGEQPQRFRRRHHGSAVRTPSSSSATPTPSRSRSDSSSSDNAAVQPTRRRRSRERAAVPARRKSRSKPAPAVRTPKSPASATTATRSAEERKVSSDSTSDSYGKSTDYYYSSSSDYGEGSDDASRCYAKQQRRKARRRQSAQQRGVGVLDPLFAVLTRQAQQLYRQPCSLVLEIVVPLVFVVVIILLWAAWGDTRYPERLFLPDSSPAVGFYASPEAANACVNLTAYAGEIGDLPPCSAVGYTVVCDGDYDATPFPAYSICRNAAVPFYAMTYGYVNGLIGSLNRVPSLNTIMTYQIFAQLDIGPLNVLGAAAVSKLYPMMVFNAIVSSGTLFFVGEAPFTEALRTHMTTLSNLIPHFSDPVIYTTVAEARSRSAQVTMTWAIVEVRSASPMGLDLVLHMNTSALPSLGIRDDPAYPGGAMGETAEMYLASGFNTLQQVVTEFYLQYYGIYNATETHMTVSFNYPSFLRIPLLLSPRKLVPLVFGIAYLYTVSQQVKRIVLEKELRIREAMLIMGLKQWAIYVSDFIIQTLLLLVVAVFSVLLLKVSFCRKGDVLLLLLVYFLFSITTVPLSGIIATFFSKARLASLVAPVIYFILVIPMFAMTNAHGPIIIAFSIFSPTAFCAALDVFLLHEVGSGFGGGDLRNPQDNPTMAVLLGMLVADFVVYYVLMLYLDAVVPKEWGTPRHPLFFVLEPLRWCRGTKPARLEGGADGRAENGVFETTEYADDVVSFDGLRKEYSRAGKTFVAVNNLYWGMREDEISVLLGHNGAGKTTLLNMMTGMVEPDEGDCYIYGHSVRTQKSRVRQLLGFCPQHNILWDELTCRDHLEFYGKIKGLKGWELENAICGMLFETDLLDKMDVASKRLSGGMKRKLSIAVAFVGGSQLVFLDEPTAGLDVAARRYVWELLQRMAQRHTILLTTHYMDEADLLGSRIGIMSQGRLKCSGSSLFLKSRLGVGYNIVISVNPEVNARTIDQFVLDRIRGAGVLSHNGTELSYLLPSSSVDQFASFLNEIDSVEAEGVRGYALSATTLEEVFLKVSEEDLDCRGGALSSSEMDVIWNCETDKSVWWSQFKATLTKRLWYALRDRRMQCFQIVCPVLCILIAMLLTLIQFDDPASLELSYDMFNDGTPPVLLTRGCDDLLGTESLLGGAVRNETRYETGAMLSNFALDTWYTHGSHRYGGLSCNDSALAGQYVATDIRNIHFINTTSHHQGGLALASYYDQLMKHLTGPSSFIRHTATFVHKADPSSATTFVFVATLIMIPMSFLPSNAVAWIVKERQCGSRHLQNLCGLNFFVYWGATFLFDMCAYVLSMCLCILIFAIFSRNEFIANDRIGATFVLFTLYGLTSTAMAYALSFLFKEHSMAQTMVMAFGLILGFLLNVAVFVMQLRENGAASADKMRWGFRFVPSYAVGEGIINLLMLDSSEALGDAHGPWDMDQIGWTLVYLFIELPIFCLITLVLDHPTLSLFFERRRYAPQSQPVTAPDEDPDVTEERNSVFAAERNSDDSSDVVRVLNLQKRYPTGNMAVKGITFSIFPGEVFGFLGTNGAGKTTTISMLCQQFLPTGGSAYVCGYDIVSESREALRCIGYCPQFDATLDLLTVEEQLRLYASIRGVVAGEQARLVEALCTLCELTQYRRTVTGELSGGNRRKLSVAMSLVGGPQVLFLDEPSAGMDPVARRGMWTAIQRASAHCSVVLTTHHLEEVEALADIVAIMVRGYIRCIGDKVHLKNKFGSAFEVSLRIESPIFAGRVADFFAEEFPGAIQNEGGGSRYVYRVPRDRRVGDIFEVLQAHKEKLHITDYSVSQTSIEQVFLRVTEDAKDL